MARKARNGSKVSVSETVVSAGVSAAQEAYVSALTGGLTESATAIEKIQSDIAGLNAQMATQVANLRTHRNQLQTLGVTLPAIPAAVLPLIADQAETTPVRRGRKARSDKGVARGAYGSRSGKRKAVKPGVRRPSNEMNLVDTLQSVLKGKQMGLDDVIVAVRKAGYKSNSPNFKVIVNQALSKDGNPFKRVERGIYTAA